MGASFGDLFAQPLQNGGLGFGTTITSVIFLGAIGAIIVYMTLKQEGREKSASVNREQQRLIEAKTDGNQASGARSS
jgi:uncharacterized membrane-anchored protein